MTGRAAKSSNRKAAEPPTGNLVNVTLAGESVRPLLQFFTLTTVLLGLVGAISFSSVMYAWWVDRDLTQKWERTQREVHDADTDSIVLRNHVMEMQAELKAYEAYGPPPKEMSHANHRRR